MWGIITFLFFYVILPAAISYGISMLLSRDAEKPELIGKEKIDIPTATEGRPLPVLFGMRRIKGVNAISPILYQWNRFSDHHGVSAVLYYIAIHLGVSQENIDGVLQIWFGDTVGWPTAKDPTDFAADGQTQAVMSLASGAETMWGVWFDGGQGGVSGTIDIQYGGSSQTLNSYLASKLGSDQPAYRGFVGLILKEPFYIGTAAILRPISVLGKRTDKLTDGSTMWYPAKAKIDRGGGVYDLNFIHMVYELLTSTVIGRGYDTSLIGNSFQDAADTCFAEGYGGSCVWDWAPDDIGRMIEQIERIVDGRLYFSIETEKYEFGLNRYDYNPAALEVFDEDDFWVESAGFLSAGRVPSKVIVKWQDRIYDKERLACDDDIALLARQGNKSEVDEKDYTGFVCDGDTANKIAARDQYAYSSMPKVFTLRCLRTMAHLDKTSVFKINYPELNITSMIVRVSNINRGSLQNGEIIIECIQDVFGIEYTCYGSPPGPGTGPAEPQTNIVVYDDDYIVYDGNTVVYN